jgi:dihydrofolate reductase
MTAHIIIIAAIAMNRALGFEGNLIYSIPNDLKRFRKLTAGHTVVMGRKTFESLPNGPLPNRRNIVISRTLKSIEGAEVFSSLDEVFKNLENSTDNEIYIIGGGQIYKEALDSGRVDKLYMTEVDDVPEKADTFFPEIPKEYDVTWAEVHTTPEGLQYSFVNYERT